LVRREGKRFRTTHLEVRYIASLLRHSRVGLIVPRHKQSAVARNRVKRRLRELSRLVLLPAFEAHAPLDVVLRATTTAYEADFDALAADVSRIVQLLVQRLSPRPG
jgi:ribonuclease P protein component